MTDNRTTELREKLTERGIEYTTNDHMGVCETSWNGFTAMQLTPNAKLTMVLTPEQAIAATLGNLNRVEIDNLLRTFGVDCAHELNADPDETVSEATIAKYVNAIAATVGNGTLTAEQVREAIERHSAWVIGNNRCFHDGAYEEIADELNAELGSEREKRLEKLVQKALDEGWCDEWWYEDARKLGLEANY